MRDITLEDTIDIKFTTRAFATGIPTTLAGTPVISAYPGNSVTQLTAGITLTVDFDGVAGLNNVRVVATAANGYAANTDYALVITTGTVGGVSVVGEVIGEFSTGRSAAAVDLANATDGLGAIKAVIPAALVGGRMDSSAGAMAANVVTAASIAAAALNGKGDWNIGKTGYALSAAGVQAIWDALTSAFGTVGSIGKKLADWVIGTTQTGDSFARLGAPAGASVSADIAAVKVDTAAIKAKTDNLPIDPADQSLIIAATDALDTQILTRATPAQVNTEVVDALNVDTYAEPAQGTPAATLSLAAKLNYLFKGWRNRRTQTATEFALYNDDAVTVDHKATVSDDGVTLDRTEIATGP